ncbi:MAG: holo-ACP synthase [Gemmatimonadota bacterium]
MTSPPELHVGIDLVQVERVSESVALHGERFLRRIFTNDEVAYAMSSPPQTLHRLAARFAAKEAVRKLLQVDEHGVGWRDVEVRRLPSGACEVVLHGHAAILARARLLGRMALSMSHDGDYATAVVVTWSGTEEMHG